MAFPVFPVSAFITDIAPFLKSSKRISIFFCKTQEFFQQCESGRVILCFRKNRERERLKEIAVQPGKDVAADTYFLYNEKHTFPSAGQKLPVRKQILPDGKDNRRGRKRKMERPVFDLMASGERMRQIRVRNQLTVKEVAEYMGFASTQAVYKWENGKCFPQADNLVALAVLYHVSPAELLVEKKPILQLPERAVQPAVA